MSSLERQKLARMSRIMAGATLLAMIAIPLGHLMTWFNVFEAHDVMSVHGSSAFIQSPTTGTFKRLVGFALTMVPQLALLYGLLHLRRLFFEIEAGRVFGAVTGARMKAFARSLLAYALLDLLITMPLSAWVTFDNPPGERMIQISVGEGHLQTWFLIALFFAFTQIMAEGMRLARENEEFV